MLFKRITAAVFALSLGMAVSVTASAERDLEPTDQVHKFDIGSDAVGGSGIETDEETGSGRNWIKVIQPYNTLQLFKDVPDQDVSAIAVTFEISEWSGKEFNVGWGALLTYYDESGNWYGFEDFKGISDYVINSNGEYTVVCDLGKLCLREEQPYGLAMMQALEMVIDGVDEGDPTTIEVKSARVYFAGEPVESAVMPDGTEIPIETAAILTGEEDETSSADESADSAEAESSAADVSSEAAGSEGSDVSAASSAAESTASAAKDEDKDEGSSLNFGAITAVCGAVIVAVAAVIVLRKKK
ncbi:hypothetical protein SAMN02910447_03223 [Ruminococcus sp. YE71]|uniref:hypothetical protein n=1 Tax=unclassified Ruminococcus TaxID=2608920 RepID=UPI0008888A1D|nr:MULTISPECIES: hypothetical protein [unclassified Ruminococcus]SDA30639.1 hypothetical protein SAMN02910446_03298 [Ruminococcus sp. YE78]SFW50002.1 hypothetical protein SAMN02910447_03223 [Ruminococcus sp. YE71]